MVYKSTALTASSFGVSEYRHVSKATTLMKTVLVLTLLAVTIACCYGRPAERANKPSEPGDEARASWESIHSKPPEQTGKHATIHICSMHAVTMHGLHVLL